MLYPRQEFPYELRSRVCGRHGWYRHLYNKKNPLLELGFDPRTLHPVVSFYTDYALPALIVPLNSTKNYKFFPINFTSNEAIPAV